MKTWRGPDSHHGMRRDFAPLSEFRFDVEVGTDANDADVQQVKAIANERCPAIWAMSHEVAATTTARRRRVRACGRIQAEAARSPQAASRLLSLPAASQVSRKEAATMYAVLSEESPTQNHDARDQAIQDS